MTISRIKYYIITLIVFLSWVGIASAGLEIIEVNYNPEVKTNHLWIKVYNNDSNNVNLKEYYVVDYDGSTWHYHTINANSSPTLASNSYAVIAKASSSTIVAFKDKNPDIPEPLFYGNLTINNEGTIGLSKITDKKTIFGTMSYGGASTPSIDDLSDNNILNDPEDENTTESESSSSSSKDDEPEIFKITTKIIAPKTATSGIPFSFSSLTTTNTGKTYAVGKFVWNFGDGKILETKKSGPFDYVYDYPGEYAVTLSYFDSALKDTPDATNKIIVKVIPSEIFISSVGNNIDPFIELENKSNYEVVLTNWVITGGMHYFNIPSGTTILPNKKIKLSPKITGFVGDDLKYITITNPNKDIVSTYPTIKIRNITQRTYSSTPVVLNDSESINTGLPNNKNSQIINLNDLSADAGGISINISNSIYTLVGLILLIGLGLTSFLIIRKRYINENYFERNVRAEDMTIME